MPAVKTTRKSVAPVDRSRVLEALWYRDNGPGKPRSHGVTRIRATVTPNPDSGVRVGVFEEYAGATGVQWRTSVWVASFIASVVTGRELTRDRFDISVGGYIDGPSAGALMTVGFIAAIAGDKILPSVTMTGTLSPDGTIGPVSGIPDKLRAAKAAKKRIVGIPAGQATAAAEDGKSVDVMALGGSLGVEVKEVADIYEAYALLTGRALPRPTPVARAKMKVPAGLLAELRGRAEVMAKQATVDLELLKGNKTPGLGRTIAVARKELSALLQHLARGDKAAAYERAQRAAGLARSALSVAGLGGGGKEYPESSGLLQETDKELKGVEKQLEALSREPTANPLVLLAGYGAVARARGGVEVARSILTDVSAEGRHPTAKVLRAIQLSGKALLAARYLTYAHLVMDFARKVLREPTEPHLALKLDRTALARAAHAFVSAATGNLEYINALLLADIAKQRKVPLDDIRNAFAQNERAYLLAAQMSGLAIVSGMEGAEASTAKILMRLQAAAGSYVASASVITKYYSLDVKVAKEGNEAKVRRQQALSALLKRAEIAAREAAAVAHKRLGIIPPDARFHYRSAVEQAAQGTPSARLQALTEFWRSTVESRTAAAVLRRATDPETADAGAPAQAADAGAPAARAKK